MPPTTTGTNDIWHGRAFGYTGGKKGPNAEFDRAFGDAEHKFVDYETVLAVNRANARNAGGRNDWTAPQIQAAAWVVAKGIGLHKKYPKRYPTEEDGIAEAALTFPDKSAKYEAFGTHEVVPAAPGYGGAKTGAGHFEGLLDQPSEVRAAFSNDPRRSWRDPVYGNDILYQAGGYQTEPSRSATGYFQPPQGGKPEVNPADVARPLVAPITDEFGRTIAPGDQAALTAIEGVRAYSDVQNMGAWHQTISGVKTSEMGSIHMPLDRQLTEPEMLQLSEIARKYGLTPSDTGRGVTLMDFSPDASGQKAKAMLNGGLQSELLTIIPGGGLSDPRRLVSGSVDFSPNGTSVRAAPPRRCWRRSKTHRWLASLTRFLTIRQSVSTGVTFTRPMLNLPLVPECRYAKTTSAPSRFWPRAGGRRSIALWRAARFYRRWLWRYWGRGRWDRRCLASWTTERAPKRNRGQVSTHVSFVDVIRSRWRDHP